MIGNNSKNQHDGVDGVGPAAYFKGSTLNGAIGDDSLASLGSLRWYLNQVWRRVKVAHTTLGARTDDWAEGLGVVAQTLLYSEFTDGGSAAGTKTLSVQIPQGAWVLRTVLENVTGFTGNTSAVITVGDGSDVDRYNTGTPSVFTTANAIDLGAPSGTQIHTAAATVTVTITGGSYFTAITAGQLTIRIYYLH